MRATEGLNPAGAVVEDWLLTFLLENGSKELEEMSAQIPKEGFCQFKVTEYEVSEHDGLLSTVKLHSGTENCGPAVWLEPFHILQ